MKKILFFLVFSLVFSVYLVQNSQAASATKKKSPVISVAAIKTQVQKAKDMVDSLDSIFRSIAVDYEIQQEVKGNNYSSFLMAGREQMQKAESALSRAKSREALDAITASLQSFAKARGAILNSAKWAATKDERIAEWQKFITEVKIRIPEALEKSIFSDNNVNLSDDILLTCAVPNTVPPRRYCQGKWETRKNQADCPYLACVKGKREVLPCAGALSYVNRDFKKGPTNQNCCPGLYLTKTKNNEFMCQISKGRKECVKETDCPQPLCTETPALCLQGKCARPACPATLMAIGPRPPGTYDKCAIEGVKDYKCSSKKTISWSCQCFNFSEQPVADHYYYCGLEPVKSCPAPTRSAPLAVTRITIRYLIGGIKGGPGAIQLFWDTNEPTISYIEYGPTTAYGSIARGGTGPVGSYIDPGTGHVVEDQGLSVGLDNTAKLRPDTTYHFRIVATDTQGNKFVSDDYTFSTVRPYGSKHWIECQAGAVMQKTCVNGELVDRCRCTADGVWECKGDIGSSCPLFPRINESTTNLQIPIKTF